MEGRAVARLVAAVLGIALAVVYPWVIEAILQRFGTRVASLGFLAFLVLSLPLRKGAPAGGGIAAAGFAVLFAAAAATTDRVFLRLVPAWVYIGLAGYFAASLRERDSIIERGARWLVPEAPDFISGYCRTVTAAWAIFFLIAAAIIATLASTGTPEAWRVFTSRNVWILMSVLMGGEFLVRKTWFRYYFHGGPFERFWSSLFPAERTLRGRRSIAYIEQYREQQEQLRLEREASE